MSRTKTIAKSSLLKKVETAFAQYENELNGNASSAAHKTRVKAIDALRTTGFPSKKSETYKYSPISRKLEAALEAVDLIPVTTDARSTFDHGQLNGHFIHITNGQIAAENIHSSEFTVQTSTEISERDASENERDSYELLNTVFSKEVLTISFPKNGKVSQPIFIIHDFAGEEVQVSQPRLNIQAGNGSEATVCEIFCSGGVNQSFTNSYTEIHVGSNAHITHVRAGLENNSIRVSNVRVDQEADSTFTSHNTDLGGDFVRNNLRVVQNGSNCETNMYGLYALSGSMHVDNHTELNHRHPNCNSNELFKGILADKSTGVFNGKIFVQSEAQKTNAFQQNNNILLSDDAVVYTKPQLEIWADDVKCSHGCTTGQLDREQIFYLRARGIGVKEAKALLLHGYALEVLNELPIKALRKLLEEKVLEVLHG